MVSAKEGRYADCEHELYDLDGSKLRRKGLHIICDNGYHRWKTLKAPMKHASDLWSARWSCNLESVRKDVEACFCILKMRWRILKNPIKSHNQTQIDNVFFTCCIILNNILLRYDNLDLKWTELEWKNYDPDANYNARYDGKQLSTIDKRAIAKQASVDTFSMSDGELEINIEYFELRMRLINHYKVARSKQEVFLLDS